MWFPKHILVHANCRDCLSIWSLLNRHMVLTLKFPPAAPHHSFQCTVTMLQLRRCPPPTWQDGCLFSWTDQNLATLGLDRGQSSAASIFAILDCLTVGCWEGARLMALDPPTCVLLCLHLLPTTLFYMHVFSAMTTELSLSSSNKSNFCNNFDLKHRSLTSIMISIFIDPLQIVVSHTKQEAKQICAIIPGLLHYTLSQLQ